MQLTIKGKQVEVGDSLRVHVTNSLKEMASKYFTDPMEGSVAFSREAHLFKADIRIHVGKGILLQSNAEALEPYPAFDLATQKLAERLRRHKGRLRDHHQKETNGQESSYYILHPEEESSDQAYPAVIAEMTTAIETLTVAEAVMRMDLANMPAMLFCNRAHGGLNMLYRRQDGNIGWVDPRPIPVAKK